MKLTKEEFRRLNNEERFNAIQRLHYWVDCETIIDLLTSVSTEEMDSKLLSILGRSYNNIGEYEKAMDILDTVPEEERDAIWYYRYAYAHIELPKEYGSQLKKDARSAFEKLEIAVKISSDDEVKKNCLELLEMSQLVELLKEEQDKYPLLAKKYFEYIEQKNEKINRIIEGTGSKKRKIHTKITSEDIKNITDSWDIIDPMWNIINIYDTYEDYIGSAEAFTLEQRYLLAITWYFSEVDNGGHHQFFFNSTGIVWEDTLTGFKHFGMNEFANNFKKVIDYCGGTIPFDREERWNMLKALEKKNEEEFFDVLNEADDFIYNYDGEENELDYIKAHPEKFVFDGEYEGY